MRLCYGTNVFPIEHVYQHPFPITPLPFPVPIASRHRLPPSNPRYSLISPFAMLKNLHVDHDVTVGQQRMDGALTYSKELAA